jgi:hypothetical protein
MGSTITTGYSSTSSAGSTGSPVSISASFLRIVNSSTKSDCVLPTPTSSTTGQLLIVRNDTKGPLTFKVGSTTLKVLPASDVTAAKQTSVVFINDGTPAWVYFGKLSV